MRSRIRCVRPSENTDHHEHPFDTQRHPFNSQECFHEAGATTDPRPLGSSVGRYRWVWAILARLSRPR